MADSPLPALCSWRSYYILLAPALIQLAETGVAIAVRVGLPVLLPEQLLGQVWMQLPLLVKFGKIWHHQRRRANPWWAAEQGSLQPVFTPILAQRPCNSGCFCSLQIVVDGSEADRTTTGRSPRPTSNL